MTATHPVNRVVSGTFCNANSITGENESIVFQTSSFQVGKQSVQTAAQT